MARMDGIIPQEIKEILQESAKSASNANWIIADCALNVFNNYVKAREEGKFEGITESDVYRAIGHYAERKPWKIRVLILVAQVIPWEVRDKYRDSWGFGYFEAIAQGIHDAEEVFEFLEQYKSGEITHPLPGRVLGVGEFLLVYDTHIRGIDRGKLTVQEYTGVDLSCAPDVTGISFVDFGKGLKYTKTYLLKNMSEDKPAALRLYSLLDEIDGLIPDVMKELGFNVLTKRSKV